MKYRKKPVVIEARQLCKGTFWEIWDWLGESAREWCWDEDEKYIIITTLEGDHKAQIDDYIIKGIKGEFYPCKPDIFELTYDRVD